MTPGLDEIRSALRKILASPNFAQAARQREFLRYVVEETLAGRGDKLKGYIIAIDVFGKGPDFDAQGDPYVRVEARRLRQRLAEYYLAEGANDKVRIELKRGSYAPEFSFAPSAEAPAPDGSDGLGRLRWSRGKSVIAGCVVVATALAFAFALRFRGDDVGARMGEVAGTPPRLRVETFENIGDPEFDYFAYGLTEDILVRLGNYAPRIRLFSVDRREDIERLALESAADYELTGTVAHMGDTVRVTARLVDARSGRQIWTEGYNERLEVSPLFQIQARISAAVATAVGEPFGPVADAEVDRVTQQPATTLDLYECSLRYLYAMRTLSRSDQTMARECFERFAARDALDAASWAMLSLLYRWEYEGGYDLLDGAEPAIGKALDAARRALDLGGDRSVPHHAMALARLAAHDFTGAKDSTERTLARDPPLASLPAIGLDLIRLGERDRGLAIALEGIERGPRTSPFFFIGPAIYYIGAGDNEEALNWAERIDAPDYIIGQVLTAALAAELGQSERARRQVNRILAAYPGFAEYGRVLIDRWAFGADVNAVLIEGLGRAGVTLADPGQARNGL